MEPRKQLQKLGDRIFRVPRVEPWRIPLALVRVPRFQSISVAVVIWGFAVTIAIGAVLLMLPISSQTHEWTNFPDALFMATSAVCVTGLAVLESGTHFSFFGQGVLAVLMQVGGFGFMASATLLLLAFGRSVGLREKLIVAESMGVERLGGLLSLLLGITFFTIICEGIGAVLLYIRFSQDYSSPGAAVWQSIFHAVSAFNNCGLDIIGHGNNIMDYQKDPLVVLTIAGLIILGGLSFLVVWDVFKKRSFRKLSLDSKMVIAVTAALLILGTVVLLAMEYNNPETLGPMKPATKVLNAFFHSVTPRTAGFNVVWVGGMTAYSLFFTIMLMFVGGASGSTAGGVKVNTFGVLLATVWSSLRGREHAEAFGREMRPQLIHRALAVAMLALGLVGIVTLVLTITEAHSTTADGDPFQFIQILFETVSAFGTVGLSTGITPALTLAGKFIIIATMFAGRLGPLTLALSLVQAQRTSKYRYPQDQVRIG
jgi:trk system potassium uptake protein TrkH